MQYRKNNIFAFLGLSLIFVFLFMGCAGSRNNNITPTGQASSAPSPSQSLSRAEEAQKFEDEGRKLQEQGNFQKALECFNQAVKMAPDKSSLYAARGLLHYQMKTYHLALEDYDKAVKMDPTSAMNYLNRGDAYLVMAKHDLAMKDYEKTIKLDPTRHGAWYHMGMIKIMRKQYKEALKDTEKAISLLPKNDEGYQFNKAFILYKLEKYDEALKAMDEVLQIAPDFDAAYKQMGDIFVEMGENNKAINCYDKAIALFDSNIDKSNRREMNLYQKDIDKGTVYLNRAVAKSNINNYKEVVEDCQNAVKTGLEDPAVYQEMAMARYEMGDYQQASADARKCLQLIDYKQPGFKKYIMAYTACIAGRQYDKALEYNTKAIEAITEDEPGHRELIIAYYERARIYHNLGKNKEALVSLETVLKNKKEANINNKASDLAKLIKSNMK